jgi:hypothetical protein
MIPKEERNKPIKIRDSGHIYQRFHERGKKLFGNVHPNKMLNECKMAIRDPMKSVIVKDVRGKESSHHCIFVSDLGGYVCLPCSINHDYITIITLEDIRTAEKPLWYIRAYNEIAEKEPQRNLPKMNYPVINQCKN